MSVSAAVFGEFDVLNHDAGPQDLTDKEGDPVEMPNTGIVGGGVRVEAEAVIPQATVADGRVELLSFRVGVGYTDQGQKYPTDVYAPAECEKYEGGGVGNAGSADNCGETGEPVDATKSNFNRWGFEARWQPRVWIMPDFWDFSPTVGVRGEVYTGGAGSLQAGAYGIVDHMHRAPLLVAGAETGFTVAPDLIGANGDLRIVGGYMYDTGTSHVEDTGSVTNPVVKDTGNHVGRLGVVVRW